MNRITGPVTIRIGQRLYTAGTIPQALKAAAALTGRRVHEATASGRSDLAARYAAEGASVALDATEPERRALPLRIEILWTPDEPGQRPPKRGRVIADHEPWRWEAVVAGTIEEHHDANKQCYAARLTVELHEGAGSPLPPPRNISWGFWGTWPDTTDEAHARTTAWAAVFEEYGNADPDSEPNQILRSVLDMPTGRKYADQVQLRMTVHEENLQEAIRSAGNPRALHEQLYRDDRTPTNTHPQAAAAPEEREIRLARVLVHVEQALPRDEAANPPDTNVHIRLLAHGVQIQLPDTDPSRITGDRTIGLLIDESDHNNPIRLQLDPISDSQNPARSDPTLWPGREALNPEESPITRGQTGKAGSTGTT